MPKASKNQALTRQWEMLKLLPAHGVGKCAKELTELLNDLGYEVSKRTVERDLRELSLVFGIIENDKTRPYGWRWQEGLGSALPGIAIGEALSLQMAAEAISRLLPEPVLKALKPRLLQARNKLDEMASSNKVARWRDKIAARNPGMPFISPKIDSEILQTVQQALLEDRQIEVVYTSVGEQQGKCITLHPLGLVQRGQILYLVATAFNYEDVLLYAIHRIGMAQALLAPKRCPENFDLKQYVEGGALEFSNGKTIALKAKIDSVLAIHLRETPLSTDMVIEGEGNWLHLNASVQDTWQLRWWILSQGSKIKIEAPAPLKKDIQAELKGALALYC